MSKKTFTYILNTANSININNGDKRFNIRFDILQGSDYKMTSTFRSIGYATPPIVGDRLITVALDLGQTSVLTNSLTQTNISKIIATSLFLDFNYANYILNPPVFIERIGNSNTLVVSIRNQQNAIPQVNIEYILTLYFEEI